MKYALIGVCVMSSVAIAGPDVPVTASVKVKNDTSVITFTNGTDKTLEEICFSGPFTVKGKKRMYDWCEPVKLAKGATATVTVCESCTTIIPPLDSVVIDSARSTDGKRWYRHGTAKAGKDGAPMVIASTGRTDWDETRSAGVQPLYELQNVSAKQISGFDVTCKTADGKDDDPTSVGPNYPIEPNEIYPLALAGSNCHVIHVDFADKTEWKR